MNEIIQTFWLLLPAGMANLAPTLFKWVPLNTPISEKLFGKNKTYRGFITGIIFAILTVYIQSFFFDYSSINIYLWGSLLGFGALFGDLVASFIKRRISIDPGRPWIPADQINWIIGSLVFASFYINISLLNVIIALVLFGLLHPLVNLIGYSIKIKENKF